LLLRPLLLRPLLLRPVALALVALAARLFARSTSTRAERWAQVADPGLDEANSSETEPIFLRFVLPKEIDGRMAPQPTSPRGQSR
jgi:hypothetical protein